MEKAEDYNEFSIIESCKFSMRWTCVSPRTLEHEKVQMLAKIYFNMGLPP
jgi:hypothetical protein